MIATLVLVLLLPVAAVIVLPAITDIFLLLRGLGRGAWLPEGPSQPVRLIFLVPAHDEALLIGRTVTSLCSQAYPPELLEVIVVADNCADQTAEVARAAGATVLERHDERLRGKHHAIGWALDRVEWQGAAAVVIIDADTVVDPDFSTQLSRWSDLPSRALQAYDHLSNERENALTRLSGLLTRTRYDIALPLKARAGLSVPMTGDGIVLGREVLKRFPWDITTITEGWELYARFTLAGMVINYDPRARLYAEETRSLQQSRTQRERWTAGRLEVLRIHGGEILRASELPLLQRIDLVAELMTMGPVMRGLLGAGGAAVALTLPSTGATALGLLCLTGIAQPAFYSGLALLRHPEPWATVRSLFYLFPYAGWRLYVAIRSLTRTGRGTPWTRTKRHAEAAPDSLPRG